MTTMTPEQVRAQQDANALQRAIEVRQFHATQQEAPSILLELVKAHAPVLLTDLAAKRRALDDAAGDLQEAKHQLKAAELGDDEAAEAIALVKVRRAERKHAEAQQAAQQAETAFGDAAARLRDQQMVVRLRAWNARTLSLQAEVKALQEKVNKLNAEYGAEMQRQYDAEIAPLVRAGAELPRIVSSSGLFSLD